MSTSNMPASGKPEGYSTVSPYLIAAGAQRVIDFLKRAFGARELRRYDLPDGSIMHAEMRIGDTVVMIGDAGESWPAVPTHLHVYVENVDETYRRALEAGGVSVQVPERKGDDPDRRGGVKDPAGNTWWIATQLTPVSVLTHSRASEVRSQHRAGRRFPHSSPSDMMDRGALSCLGRQVTTNHRHGSDRRISLSERPNRQPESCCDAGRAAWPCAANRWQKCNHSS